MQALRAGQLQPSMLAAQPKAGRPGLSTMVLDEADLMLSMPGYEADLRDIIPKVSLAWQARSLQGCHVSCHANTFARSAMSWIHRRRAGGFASRRKSMQVLLMPQMTSPFAVSSDITVITMAMTKLGNWQVPESCAAARAGAHHHSPAAAPLNALTCQA